ncbi:putative methyltransferase-domain-containing protein [Irpex rosettiformis]|uniref:Methyltransferase-domain-containing protein n=1 Tax=Irpex rosettiformis TaxID=378272 RepID=A0ACB8TP18_9APHY|nr:putative methyltransferase-domain-containing protein [Irpex rosettiformis]
MYYYISFLRPPPFQVTLASPLTITPQIANDLRTECYPDAHDLYYSWALENQTSTFPSTSQPRQISRPVKLTTWRENNAYRELTVLPPQGVKEGQRYRLVLLAQPQGMPHVINFAAGGSTPYPVMSMPILFSSRSRPTGSKQEQVERIYRLPTSLQSQAFLHITEQTSFDLDKKVWDSGLGLSSWLSEAVCTPDGNEIHPLRRDLCSTILSKKCDIIELGSGTGIVSLSLGSIRSEKLSSEADGRIITTDLPSAMPLLEHNISANERYFSSVHTRPQALVLDWDDECLPAEVASVGTGFDLIVMADVAYNTASFASLIRTMDRILSLGDNSDQTSSPLVLLGYKERDATERSLWDMLLSIGVELKKIGEKVGAGGCPVEVWIGRRGNTPTP